MVFKNLSDILSLKSVSDSPALDELQNDLKKSFVLETSLKMILCIRELLFTLFKIKHFFIYACQTVRKSELACKIRNFSAHVRTELLFCTPNFHA